ncbi:hypothetical protein [Polaromonas sp. LjRoot131]|jgi:cell division protein FtsW (lipid II flippase)|uniref:hypothetical protein n=1 Tax=Polaromonas sp. LjRoot131 TaxID=3342262 RepID=UPI003ECF767A
MEMQEHDKSKPTTLVVPLATFVVSLCILGALMYYSAAYPYPSGRRLGLMSFVMLWLREIVILVFAVGALALLVVCRSLAVTKDPVR